MIPSSDSSAFRVDVKPNPANEGGSVTIRGDGGKSVYIMVPGKKGRTKVKLDGEGKATIKVPVKGGEEFIVAPAGTSGQDVVVDVVSGFK